MIKYIATIAKCIVGIHLKFSLKASKFKYSSLEAFQQLSTWSRRSFVLIDTGNESLPCWHKEHAILRLVARNDLQLVHEKCSVAFQMLLFYLQTCTKKPPFTEVLQPISK